MKAFKCQTDYESPCYYFVLHTSIHVDGLIIICIVLQPRTSAHVRQNEAELKNNSRKVGAFSKLPADSDASGPFSPASPHRMPLLNIRFSKLNRGS
jgi:hypothetical protein